MMHCTHKFQEKVRKKLFWYLTDLILIPMQCILSEATGCSRLMWQKIYLGIFNELLYKGGRKSEETNSAWHLPSWPLPTSSREKRAHAPALRKASFSSSPLDFPVHSPVTYQSQLKDNNKKCYCFFLIMYIHTLSLLQTEQFSEFLGYV